MVKYRDNYKLWNILEDICQYWDVGANIGCANEPTEMKAGIELPLSKALGFSIFKNLDNSLQNKRFGRGYMELYNEMLKVSQETIGKLDEEGGDYGVDLIRLKDAVDRRRSVRLRNAIGRRRSRSQALRREKLNSQSLRSHLEHSKLPSSRLEHYDMNNE